MKNYTFPTVNMETSLLVLFLKRLFDIAIGIVGTLIFIVTFPIIAFLIKIDSRGCIIFKQERVGVNRRALNDILESKYHKLRVEDVCGKPFMLYKYRSMRIDAECTGPRLANTHKDERITKVGNWLRATHIDELPQFWNILKGDMSFIGPRPERPHFTKQYKKIIPNYSQRTLFVKPGLTGLAQITLGYDDSIESVMFKSRLDITYKSALDDIWHWFSMEVWIIVHTLFYLTNRLFKNTGMVPIPKYFL